MLTDDLLNLSAGLAEAVRTNRVTPALVADAVLQLSGMVAQAAVLEQRPLFHVRPQDGMDDAFSPVEPVEVALELLRQALALEARRAMARAS